MPNIPKEREVYFLVLLSSLLVAGSVALVLTTKLSWQNVEALVVISTAISIIVVEGGAMLAERYLKRRYREGREEERAAWVAWNERRIAFEAAHPNETFPEPPPPEMAANR